MDKHSTGGVGDKTSLVLAPLAAELGLCVPMMSGRGLGHTAGTLDKLEAIPGFRTQLTLGEFRSVLNEVGVAMIGQTEEIAPLDRRLYALRDATATVPSIPLIAASIMSKKLAEGLQGLVLDVKTGEGAFLPDMKTSRRAGPDHGVPGGGAGCPDHGPRHRDGCSSGPGRGEWAGDPGGPECLAGEGPEDLAELSAALVGEMLFLGGLATSPAEAGAPGTGSALDRGGGWTGWRGWWSSRGAIPGGEDPKRIPRAPEVGVLAVRGRRFRRRVSHPFPWVTGWSSSGAGGGGWTIRWT